MDAQGRLCGVLSRLDVLRTVAAAGAQVALGRRLDPDLSPDLLRLLVAASLLRLACIHLGRGLEQPRAARLLRREGRSLTRALERLTDDRPSD